MTIVPFGEPGAGASAYDDTTLDRICLKNLLSAASANFYFKDLGSRFVRVSDGKVKLFGAQDAAEVLGKTDFDFFTEEHARAAFEDEQTIIRTGVPVVAIEERETWPDRADTWVVTTKMPLVAGDGQIIGTFGLTVDITELKRLGGELQLTAAELRRTEDALRKDPLTGLANRVLLMDRLQQALTRLERQPGRLAVLFVDLDGFKAINDRLGHASGDALLTAVGVRLRQAARRSDTVARFGGDEFVVLCDRMSVGEDIAVVANRISRALAGAFHHGEHVMHVTGSIGIAVTDNPLDTPEMLLRNADTAMYQAKHRGRRSGGFQLFDAGVRENGVTRRAMEGQLGDAVARGEFTLAYQPMVMLTDVSRLIGFTARLRWQHPTRGLLDTEVFAAAAEHANLIVPIGRWAMDDACRQLAEWNADRDSLQPLTVAVKVSDHQLRDSQILGTVADCLAGHLLEPSLLTLEVSEKALLGEAASPAVLENLSALGVRLAVDAFGTGYSSLGQLRYSPVSALRIDRSLVSGLEGDQVGSAIVSAVTSVARAFGVITIGEGIDTPGQLDELRRLGCDAGQGDLLGRPMTAAEVTAYLESGAGLS